MRSRHPKSESQLCFRCVRVNRRPYVILDDVSYPGESAHWGVLLKFPLHFSLKVIKETTTEKSDESQLWGPLKAEWGNIPFAASSPGHPSLSNVVCTRVATNAAKLAPEIRVSVKKGQHAR